jgi:hypothetical protein
MSRAMSLLNEFDHENPSTTSDEGTCAQPWFDNVRWTTKQVIVSCLWSALFGVGCGYAWVLLQVGTVVHG